jgi:uncharacterized membrane-anchored protein
MTGASIAPVFHPDRDKLFNELHTRPFPMLATPTRVSQCAILHEGLESEAESRHIFTLCERHGVHPPAIGASCFYQNFGSFEFRWERHAEFSTYTFLSSADNEPFTQSAIQRVAAEWVSHLPRPVMSAMHIEVRQWEPQHAERESLSRLFEGHRLISSHVVENAAQVWTAYRIHGDGFLRFLVINESLNPCQAGRLVRSLLELETYRMMMLLGLPVAKSITPDLRAMEEKLARMTRLIKGIENLEDERELLSQLSELAAQTEELITASNYRFNASNAYYALVMSRLDELHESAQSGLMTLAEFLNRRMSPAYRTCEGVSHNLDELAARIDRASELLRTRVNLQIEAQNQQLLRSMDDRSSMQLRLQQAVEGLSIVAITYYGVGLLKYLLNATTAAGLSVPKAIIVGIAVPVLLFSSWAGVRSLKKSLHGDKH